MSKTLSSFMVLNTVTSTHPGSGSELSYVDLPIQREKINGFPKIEASSLKGSLRSSMTSYVKTSDQYLKNNENIIETLFGASESGEFASAVSLTDANILFFPVKSVVGVFAWITCPCVIQKFLNNTERILNIDKFKKYNEITSTSLQSNTAVVSKESKLVCSDKQKIMLEDYVYELNSSDKYTPIFTNLIKELEPHLPQCGMLSRLIDHSVLVSDDEFSNYVKYSTEIHDRIRINQNTGVVENGALFTEELLPPECIFYSLLFFNQECKSQKNNDTSRRTSTDIKKEFEQLLNNLDYIQVGGDATLGKGIVGIKAYEENYDECKKK